MLHTKTNPLGIDFVIQRIQSKLYSKLLPVWANANYEAYGRCYRNRKDNGYIAEIFNGDNDYKEIYWDDTLDALSFFGMSPVQPLDYDYKAKIHVVFFVNVAALKPTYTERADEEVRLDVYRALRRNIQGSVPISVSTGIENVLKEYRGSYTDTQLKNIDMHPVHVFRFDFDVRYNPLHC